MKLEQLVVEYEYYQKGLKKLATETTLRSYVTLIREFIRWINLNAIEQVGHACGAMVTDLSDIVFGRFYDSVCARVPKKALQVRAACRSWAKYLMLKRWIVSDFTAGVELPECDPSARVAPPEADLDKMLTAVETMHVCGNVSAQGHKRHVIRTVMYLLIFCGLRRKEIYDLRIQDIDAETRRIFVRFGKGGHEGYVTPPAEFWPVIRAYLKQRPSYPGDILLVYSVKAPLGEHGVSRIFENVLKAAGLDGKGITPHCCRHAFAMRGIENGADIKTVQAQMRHVHPQTTMKYLVTNRPVSDDKAALFGRAAGPTPPAIPTPVPPPAAPVPSVEDLARQRRRIAVFRRE